MTTCNLRIAQLLLALFVLSASPTIAQAAQCQDPQATCPDTAPSVRKQVVFIASSVTDRDHLIDAVSPGTEIVLLHNENPIGQMARWARSHDGYDAIHLISHGSEGALDLGGNTLDRRALDRDEIRANLARLGRTLKIGGDLLIYGCNVAGGKAGEAFIAALATATDADVAASDDLTGAGRLGGDWTLEKTQGEVEVAALQPLSYGAVLVTEDFETFSSGDTSFTSNGVNFSLTNNLRIYRIDTYGSGGGNFFVDTGYGSGVSGNVGSFTVTNAYTFELTGLHLWTSNDAGNNYSIGTVRLTGTLAGGGTVTQDVLVEPTGITGNDWDTTNTISNFAGQQLISLAFEILSGANYLAIDKLSFTPQVANSTPTLSIANTTLPYTENNAATQVDSAGTANDADGDADWNGGTLEVQITANAEAADEVSIPDNLVGSISTGGLSLLNGATTIGTLSASEGTVTAGTKLTITFNGNATNALVQQVLRAISYRNTSENPGPGNRTVTFTVRDKNAAAASDTRTISVTPLNDAPVLNPAFPIMTSIDEDVGANSGNTVGAIVANGSITDPDGAAVEAIAVISVDNSNGSWRYNAGSGWTTFSGTTGAVVDLSGAARLLSYTSSISFTPNPDYHGTSSYTFRAWDQTSGTNGGTADTATNGGSSTFSTASDTATITVRDINDPPTLTTFAGTVDTTPEEAAVEIGFAELTASGDEADIDGTVVAFVVQAVSSGSLKIGADAGSAAPFAVTTNDTVDSTNKAYWTPATNATGGVNAFTAKARDDDAALSASPVQVSVSVTAGPELSVSATSADKDEGNSGTTAFTFTVTRAANTSGTTTVDYAVSGSGGSPADAADFGGSLPSGPLSFADTEGSKLITIDVSGDTTVESDEGFTLTLSNPSGNADIIGATATGTIRNDDSAALTLTIAVASISEGAGTAATTATVSRNTDTTNALTVNLSSSDTGEATVPASVTIGAGQTTSAPFNINAVDDTVVDGTQTVTITASAAGHANGTDTLDVTDDEVQTFTGPTATGTGDATLTITGSTCALDLSQTAFIPTDGLVLPPRVGFPHGAVRFRIVGCEPGATAEVTLAWPSALLDTEGWKLDGTADPFTIPGATVVGNTYRYSIIDGGALDGDGVVDGNMEDPSAPGMADAGGAPVGPPINEIPTLSEWAKWLLMIGLLGLGWRMLGAGRRGTRM